MNLSTHWRANRPRRQAVLAGGLALALGLSACGGAANPLASAPNPATPAPSVPTPAPTASPAASVAASIAPTALPVTAPPLVSLALRWKGSGPVGSKTSTYAVTTDPKTGNVWVGVPFESHFWIFSPKGKYLESWGVGGKGDGQFDLLSHQQTLLGCGGIAFAPDGSFYVADVGNFRIEKFDKDRKFEKAWGQFGGDNGQFVQACTIATDGTTVYVGDGGGDAIQAFDTSGTFLRRFGADGSFGAYIALDNAGNVYADNPGTGSTALAKFDQSGKEIARVDMGWAGGDPVGLAVEPNGNIVLGIAQPSFPGDGLGTYELDPTGRPIRGWSVGGGEELGLSPNGDTLYVTRGIDPTVSVWTDVKAYALPKP